MEMPNLHQSAAAPGSNTAVVYVNGNNLILTEVKNQLSLAGPLIITNVLQFLLQVISVMFIGHIGELPLSGASMAFSFAGVTGFSLLLGMASALDTLCGQAFGAEKYYMLGIYLQRALVVITITSIPISVTWAYTEKILILFGQNSEIAAAAGLYARWLIPSIFAYGFLQCQMRFLQAQSIVVPVTLSSGVVALFHLLISWTLVFKSGLGSKGAALSTAISSWINVLLLALYIKLSPTCKSTWIGFSAEAWRDVIGFVKLAIPSAAMLCLEFWPFELLVLLPGRLPNPKLETAVQSICLNTFSMIYMVQFGLSGSVSTRVSNELGAGYSKAARLAVKVVILIAISEGLLIGSIMVLARNVWGHAYSNDENIVRHIAAMMPILAASSLLDGIQSVLIGAVRGCGRQKIGAFVNLGSFYVVAIPTGVVLAFVLHMSGKGLWLGISCGLASQVVLLGILIICTNWEKEARKANDRVSNSMMQADTST